MAAVALRLRVWRRARWRSALLTGLLCGIVAGAVLAVAVGAGGQPAAPDRYTEAAGGDPDVVIYQPAGLPLTDEIRQLPGVTSVDAITFVLAFLLRPDGTPVDEPNPFAGDDDTFGARVVEGRFVDPDNPGEITVNESAASLLGAEVGDRFQVRSFDQAQTDAQAYVGAVEPAGPSFEVELVGIVRAPADLEDASATIIYSPAVLRDHPAVGRVATIAAVRLAPGTGVDETMAAVRSLPGGGRGVPGHQPDRERRDPPGRRLPGHRPVDRRGGVRGRRRGCGQPAGGAPRALDAGRAHLARALGYRGEDAASEAAVKGAVVGVVAAAVAAVVATLASRWFPLGILRGLEPSPGVVVDLPVLLVGGALTVAVLVAAATLSTLGSDRRATAAPTPRRGMADALASAGAGVAVVTGARFAFSSARRRVPPWVLVTGVIVGLAGLVGSIVVGASLVRLVQEPARWGRNFDAAYGNPFAPATRDIVSPLAEHSRVDAVTAATTGSLALDGADVAVTAVEPIHGGILPVILEGRGPSAPDEIALGRVAARRLDRGIGSTVEAVGPNGTTAQLTVVGLGVSPDEAGDGAIMSWDGYVSLAPDATRNLVFVRYGPDFSDADAAQLAADAYTPPDVVTLPTQVQALDRVTSAPFVLAAVLVILALVALGHGLVTSVRSRTHDLAVLRALGGSRHQLRATVHWQATSLALLALAVAVPVGLIAGGRIFSLLADNVGVVPVPDRGALLVIGLVALVLVLANLAAIVPSHRAGRSSTARAVARGVIARAQLPRITRRTRSRRPAVGTGSELRRRRSSRSAVNESSKAGRSSTRGRSHAALISSTTACSSARTVALRGSSRRNASSPTTAGGLSTASCRSCAPSRAITSSAPSWRRNSDEPSRPWMMIRSRCPRVMGRTLSARERSSSTVSAESNLTCWRLWNAASGSTTRPSADSWGTSSEPAKPSCHWSRASSEGRCEMCASSRLADGGMQSFPVYSMRPWASAHDATSFIDARYWRQAEGNTPSWSPKISVSWRGSEVHAGDAAALVPERELAGREGQLEQLGEGIACSSA